MTIRSVQLELLALVLLTWCCLPGVGEDHVLVAQQPEQSPSDRLPLAPAQQGCPTLEELGYQFRMLADISLDIHPLDPDTPDDCSVNLFRGAGADDARPHEMVTEFTWVANELYHQPLYFEDAILERSGQSHHPLLQPWLSGAHFFTTFPIMPYKIGLDRLHDRVYTLGYHRPGSPTPCLGNRLPLEPDAAIFEAGVWVGLLFLLP